MDTDVEWTWTFLMKEGKHFKAGESVTLKVALIQFRNFGYEETEIEAIVRH